MLLLIMGYVTRKLRKLKEYYEFLRLTDTLCLATILALKE